MQAAQAAGMYALVAGFGYLGDDDRADTWFPHGWLDSPLELLDWLDKPRSAKRAMNGSAARGSPGDRRRARRRGHRLSGRHPARRAACAKS